MEQPVFGWAGWGLALMCNDVETGRPVIAVPDGLWIIVLGNNGIVGLILWSLVMMVPTLRFMWLYKAGMVHRPGVAPAAALAVVLALYMVDSLFNAMLNPIFVVCAGGLSGLGYCAVKTNGCSAPVWREVPRGGTASSVIAPVGRVTDARV
jgi:O-antigen ligase